MRFIDMPKVWLAGFAAIAWVQSRFLPMPLFGQVGDWNGVALVVLGVAAVVASFVQMMVRRTTADPHGVPKSLVTGGMFRFSRNPIYLGDAMILLGLILIWDAMLSMPLVPLFLVVIDRRFIRVEEERLRATFGAEFDAYATRTARWL